MSIVVSFDLFVCLCREEAERQAREREAREREAREREARERERKLEVERERRLREEKERERRERERVEEERVKLERAAKLEREREQKRKQDELKWEQRDREQRDREQRDRDQRLIQQQQQQRLGKRSSYQDSPSFDMSKRQAVHDLRGNSGIHGNDVRSGGGAAGMGSGNLDVFDMSSSVFSRLDPQKQAAAAVGQLASGIQSITSMMQGGKTGVTSPDSYARRSVGDTGGGGGGVGYRPGGGGFGGGPLGRDRHLESVSYPMSGIGKGGQNSPNYPKTSGIGGGVTVVQKGGLSRQNQEIISAALANIQKSVHQSSTSAPSQAMRMAGSSPIGQQISPGGHMGSLGDFVSLNRGQSVGGPISSMGGVGRPLMGPMKPMKLPPEEERYNRRFSRPSPSGRQPNIKRF